MNNDASDDPPRHIRDERTTRIKRKLVGTDRETPTNSGTTWCGRDVYSEWLFQNVEHALGSAANGDGIAVCAGCVRAVRAALDELPGGGQ